MKPALRTNFAIGIFESRNKWDCRSSMTGKGSISVTALMIIEDLVIVEIKCVEAINPVHKAQLLSYIRLSGRDIGLLINFHVAHLRDGIKRMVDGNDWEK